FPTPPALPVLPAPPVLPTLPVAATLPVPPEFCVLPAPPPPGKAPVPAEPPVPSTFEPPLAQATIPTHPSNATPTNFIWTISPQRAVPGPLPSSQMCAEGSSKYAQVGRERQVLRGHFLSLQRHRRHCLTLSALGTNDVVPRPARRDEATPHDAPR